MTLSDSFLLLMSVFTLSQANNAALNRIFVGVVAYFGGVGRAVAGQGGVGGGNDD